MAAVVVVVVAAVVVVVVGVVVVVVGVVVVVVGVVAVDVWVVVVVDVWVVVVVDVWVVVVDVRVVLVVDDVVVVLAGGEWCVDAATTDPVTGPVPGVSTNFATCRFPAARLIVSVPASRHRATLSASRASSSAWAQTLTRYVPTPLTDSVIRKSAL